LSSAAAAPTTASDVLTELVALSVDEWLTAAVLPLAEESTADTGEGLTGLPVPTSDDELSVVLDADFDTDDLQ